MQYDWVLFDADETLFHFDAFSGLKKALKAFGVDFTESHFEEYQSKNKPLWVQYQNDEIDAETLKMRRFELWARRLNVTEKNLNSAFLNAMAEISTPLDGVLDLLESLKGQVKMAIITNGFTDLQKVRLARNGLNNTFEFLAISEQVGAAKPSKKIFDYAFEKMGQPARGKVLIVGDTLKSDILGGVNAGIDTCWYNPHHHDNSDGILPTFEVSSHQALKQRLIKA
jgi:5'-nucleotidase